MGVYINMEMPGSCDECILNNGITCYAVPDYKEDGVVGRTDDRPDWCPLIPVPKHGRLIDADAFKKYIAVSFEEVAPELEGGYKWLAERITNDLLKDIDDAPTIIPADPAEEGE